ncbi:MAG: hypothetical protein EOO73_25675 [Myxococcales bacterium]|nr:MAG: hypothetical protein EOO73_25675 [Myxococcales bacterium]
MRDCWSALAGVLWFSATACGPGQRPPEGCDGPSFNLVVQAEEGPLPPDTRINVLYGSNQEGEPYALGQPGRKQAVFCEEDTVQGGAPSERSDSGSASAESGGAGGAPSEAPAPPEGDPGAAAERVWALRCRLYTQGPARLDVTATGYEPIEDRALSFADDDRCDVEALVVLTPLPPEMED